MAAKRESNQRLYDSKEKREVRKEIIGNATHSLTKGGSTSACIKYDYLGDLLKQLQANGTLSPERIQSITRSLELIHTNITGKRANQLKVCFLAGDYPLEDVEVFVNNGVLDKNIWVFEKDPKIALKAKNAIKQSSKYRGIKFYACDIITFFENYNQRFDIIYFDTCGPLPAERQKTLKAIASIFQLNRLESPGALITNFSFPPEELAESEERKQITFVAKEYLQQKLETTLHQKTDEQIYSDFITHQVIDLASLLGPASHILRELKKWEEILILDVRTFFETVREHLLNSNDSTSDDLDKEAMKAIVNNFYLTKICRAMKREDKTNPVCKAWLREVFPRSKGPSESFDICELLQTALLFSSFTFLSKFTNDATQEFLQPASRDEDKELMAGIVLGAQAEPSYPVLDKLLRLKYTQSDEKKKCKRQMFCDVFIFDRCRYLFGLPPTVNIAGQFCNDDDDDFLMSKMLLDGMRRQLKCLCKTGIFQIDFRRQFGLSGSDGNDEELCTCLPERKIVE